MSYSVDDTLGLVNLALAGNLNTSGAGSTLILQSALKACQVALEKERDQVKQLTLENESLKAEIEGSIQGGGANRPRGQWLTHPRLLPHKSDITKYAKKYAVLSQLWADESAFLQQRPNPCPTLRGIYVDSKAVEASLYTACATEELFDCMPLQLHSYIVELPAFRDSVLNQMGSFRSSAIAILRKLCPIIFADYNLAPNWWIKSHNRGDDLACLSLISCNPGPSTEKPKYDLFCPIIYLDPKDPKPTEMFLNPALMKIGRFLLFGPGSLNEKTPSMNSSGMKWGPITTTSGLISASVNIAVYLLSEDSEFSAIGKETGISYANTFRDRKKFIEQMSNEAWAQRMFARWNLVVFDGVPDHIHFIEESQIDDELEIARLAVLEAIDRGQYGQNSIKNNKSTPVTSNFEEDFPTPPISNHSPDSLSGTFKNLDLPADGSISTTSSVTTQSNSGSAMQRLAAFPPTLSAAADSDSENLDVIEAERIDVERLIIKDPDTGSKRGQRGRGKHCALGRGHGRGQAGKGKEQGDVETTKVIEECGEGRPLRTTRRK